MVVRSAKGVDTNSRQRLARVGVDDRADDPPGGPQHGGKRSGVYRNEGQLYVASRRFFRSADFRLRLFGGCREHLAGVLSRTLQVEPQPPLRRQAAQGNAAVRAGFRLRRKPRLTQVEELRRRCKVEQFAAQCRDHGHRHFHAFQGLVSFVRYPPGDLRFRLQLKDHRRGLLGAARCCQAMADPGTITTTSHGCCLSC